MSVLVSVQDVSAADLGVAPPAGAPAVDGFNGKIDGFGGSLGSKSYYGASGALSIPLAQQYGMQIEGLGGSYDGNTRSAASAVICSGAIHRGRSPVSTPPTRRLTGSAAFTSAISAPRARSISIG